MEETMKDYEKELEASFRKIREGDVISGTVIDVNEEEVTLDLKYYTQGIIKAEDMSNDPAFSLLNDVKAGDVIEATVIRMDDGQGNILLSKKEANEVLSWDVLEQMKEEKTDVTVKVSEAVNGGAVAYVEGIRGFIPASQLDLNYVEDSSAYVGKNIKTCGESPKALQEMLTQLDFITDDGFYVISGTERDENYNFKVVIYHSQQVDMDGLDCGFGFESRIGTVCSSVMYWEQEKHPEQTVITVSPDRFNRTLTDEEVSKLTLSVAVRDTSGEWHEVCEALPLHAKYGDLLKYTLEENSEDGYSLKEN